MSKLDNLANSLVEDPGSYYAKEFYKMEPHIDGSVRSKAIGKHIASSEIKLTADARNELMWLAKDEPFLKMYMEDFMLICLGREPRGFFEKLFYKWAKKAAEFYIPQSRRGHHLRVFLISFPLSLFSPISLLILMISQLVSYLQMRKFLASHPTWTIFGYLRYESNFGYLAEGYHYLPWFFTGPVVEDNMYRMVLNVFITIYMLPYSLCLTFWRITVMIWAASLGICALSGAIRTQYYCGGSVTIEMFLWSHFMVLYYGQHEIKRSFIKLMVIPTVSVLNILVTVASAPYKDAEHLFRHLLAHPVGMIAGVTSGYQILKQHGDNGWNYVCHILYYLAGMMLYCGGYLINNYYETFGPLMTEITRTDWRGSDLASP